MRRTLLDTNEIHLWRLQLDVEQGMLAALEATLAPHERHKASRFRSQRDTARYVATHGLVRKVLGEYLSLPPSRIEFELGRWGKPRLSATRHAAALHFNYSYSQHSLLLALSATREIGVDIERRRNDVEMFDIAAQHFSLAERQIIHRCTTPEEAFFRCWTAKEALVKAMGVGLSQPLKNFTTLLDARSLVSRVGIAHDGELPYAVALRSLQVGDDYCAALAVMIEDDADGFAVVLK